MDIKAQELTKPCVCATSEILRHAEHAMGAKLKCSTIGTEARFIAAKHYSCGGALVNNL